MLTPKETPLHEHISKKNEEEDFKNTESLKTESTISSEGNAAVPASDLEKKKRRTERFGVSVQLSEEEKRNSRSERFVTGPTFHESNVSQKSEEQKKKARAERFGLPSQSLADEEAKKKARLARFAAVSKMDTSEEEKKKARAIRFSPPTSGASSQVNGSANSEQKTAIVGKANGGT